MIRNNLASLLAERSLKITKVANDTGISRNTITNTAQNDGIMLQLETINKLCQYLNIQPQEFFSYLPFDLDFSCYVDNIKFVPYDFYVDDPSDPFNVRPASALFIKDLTIDGYLKKFSLQPLQNDVQTDEISFVIKNKHNNIATFSNYELEYPQTVDSLTFEIEVMLDGKKEIAKFNKLYNSLPAGFQADLKGQISNVIIAELKKTIKSWADDNGRTNNFTKGVSVKSLFSFKDIKDFERNDKFSSDDVINLNNVRNDDF